jgi:hypothetical protein
MTEWTHLAESSKKGYGSRRDVLPMMMVVVMMMMILDYLYYDHQHNTFDVQFIYILYIISVEGVYHCTSS